MKNLLWLTPFVAFILGYQLVNLLTRTNEFPAPALVGLPIGQAVKILSEHNLNARILHEKDEWDLPPGTVLSQMPRANNKVKAQQPVFLVLARKPSKKIPELLNRLLSDVQALADHSDLRLKIYHVPSQYPANTCIGQFPSPGHIAETNKMIVYLSSGAQKPHIFPEVRNLTVGQVTAWLQPYPAHVTVVHNRPIPDDHYCSHCIIVDQKPLPGAIIETDKPFTVKLEVN